VLTKPIGAGASGVVYEAHDQRLDRAVAVKVLCKERGNAASARARLELEARAIARLKSPHVVQVLDVCTTDGGLPCIVTELLEGSSLERELNKRGALGWSEALPWMLDLCDALGEAHEHGIVHRDVKPANLFLIDGPRRRMIKVLDFGVSKVLPRGDLHTHTLTAEGAIVGTPAYMAPEQLTAGGEISPATDVWAIGVLMQELLTGRRPFEAGSFPELCAKILQKRPAPFRPAFARSPVDLGKIVGRCLKRAPRKRYATARELGIAIGSLLEAHEIITQTHRKSRRDGEAVTLTSEELLALPRRRTNWLLLVLAASGLGVLVMMNWAVVVPLRVASEVPPDGSSPSAILPARSANPPEIVPLTVAAIASAEAAPPSSASAAPTAPSGGAKRVAPAPDAASPPRKPPPRALPVPPARREVAPAPTDPAPRFEQTR
jgi:serine/threonine-protein kinase